MNSLVRYTRPAIAFHWIVSIAVLVLGTLCWPWAQVSPLVRPIQALLGFTNFPYADTTRLIVKGDARFDLKIRVPQWATRGFHVTVNGRQQTLPAEPGRYVSLGATWRANDTIDVRMPFGFSLDPDGAAGRRQRRR